MKTRKQKRNLKEVTRRALAGLLVMALLLTSAPVQTVSASSVDMTTAEQQSLEDNSAPEETSEEINAETTETKEEKEEESPAQEESSSDTSEETTTEIVSTESEDTTEDSISTESATTEASGETTTEESTEITIEETSEDSPIETYAVDEPMPLANGVTIGLKGHSNGIWHWTADGSDAYCLTHGLHMETGLVANIKDISTSTNEKSQILASLMALYSNYNSSQLQVWNYLGGTKTNPVYYATYLYKVKKSLTISNGHATKSMSYSFSQTEYNNLKAGKEVKHTYKLTDSASKNIQNLFKYAKELDKGTLPALYSFSSDDFIRGIKIENASKPGSTFQITLTYQLPEDIRSKDDKAIEDYIIANGKMDIDSATYKFGKSLTWIKWTTASYANATSLQDLGYGYDYSNARVRISLSAKASGFDTEVVNLKAVKMDSSGNVYYSDGAFQCYIYRPATGAYEAYGAPLTSAQMAVSGWDFVAGEVTAKNVDVLPQITIQEVTPPTGTSGSSSYYAGELGIVNGQAGFWDVEYDSGSGTKITSSDGDDYYFTPHTFNSGITNTAVVKKASEIGIEGNTCILINQTELVPASIAPKVLEVPVGYDKETGFLKMDYRPVKGIAFDIYLAEDLSDGEGESYSYEGVSYGFDRQIDEPESGGTYITTIYTNNAGNASVNLVVGPDGHASYYARENIDKSRISNELKELLRPSAMDKQINYFPCEVGEEIYFSGNISKLVEGKNINKTVDINIPIKKVYKENESSLREEPLEGAEFALYASKDMKNILNENIFADNETTDAIVEVKNHQPIYESGKWVQVATGTTNANGDLTFSFKCPAYGMEDTQLLIAELTPPEGYRRMDYDRYEYRLILGEDMNRTAYNGNSTYTQNFYNTDEAAMKIHVYKYGEEITGAELKSTAYGNYYALTRTSNYPLAGVKFEIINSRGKLVDTITTNSDGYAESTAKLSSGTYTVRESEENKKFHVNKEDEDADDYWSQEITLKPDETKELTVFPSNFRNNAIPVNLLIKKNGEIPVVNETNPTEEDLSQVVEEGEEDTEKLLDLIRQTYTYDIEPLDGVVFGIYTKNDITAFDGTVIVPAGACVGITTTDENGEAKYSDKYPDGEYFFKEIKTQDASKYILDDKEYPFTIELDGSKEINMDLTGDKPIVNKMFKGSITLLKKDSKTTYPLARVTFGLYDEDHNLISTAMTDEGGGCAWYDLPAGKYYVKELTGREGYDKNENEYPIYVTRDKLDVAKIITNTEISGRIKVIKRDKDDNTILIPGVVFNLVDEMQNVIGTYSTDENGEFVTEDLPLGKYYLVETRTARGYILDETSHEVDITDDARYPEINIYNEAKRGSIKVIKTDGSKTIYLEGVVFSLYDGNHDFLGSYTTDANGEIYIDYLRVGTYYLQETHTKKGYELNEDVLQVDLTDTNLDVVLNLVNYEKEEKSVSLDSDSDSSASDRSDHIIKTGDHPFRMLFLLIALFLSVAGLVILSIRKQKMVMEGTVCSQTKRKLNIPRFLKKFFSLAMAMILGVGCLAPVAEKPQAADLLEDLESQFGNQVVLPDFAIVAVSRSSELQADMARVNYYLPDSTVGGHSFEITPKSSFLFNDTDITYNIYVIQYGFGDKEDNYRFYYSVSPLGRRGFLGNSPFETPYININYDAIFNGHNTSLGTVTTTESKSEMNLDLNFKALCSQMDYINAAADHIYVLYSHQQNYTYNPGQGSGSITATTTKTKRVWSNESRSDKTTYTFQISESQMNDAVSASENLTYVLPLPRVNGFTTSEASPAVRIFLQKFIQRYATRHMDFDQMFLPKENVSPSNNLQNFIDSFGNFTELKDCYTIPTYTPIQKDGYVFNGSAFSGDKTAAEFDSVTVNEAGNKLFLDYSLNGNVLTRAQTVSTRELFNPYYPHYSVNKDITENDITYHLDNDYHATVTAIDGTDVIIPQEVSWDNHVFTVTAVDYGVSMADTVTTVTLPDTIRTVPDGAFEQDSITDVYLDSPAFDTEGVFQDGVTIHCYKGTASADSLMENYPNSVIEYYQIPITYELNGGAFAEGDTVQDALYYRTSYAIPEPEKEGYTFIGWYQDEALKQIAPVSPYYENVSEDDPEVLTYYAKWIEVVEITPEENSTFDDGNYEDTSISPAEQERLEKQQKAEADAKAAAEAAAKANEEATASNQNLVKDDTPAVVEAKKKIGSGKIKYSNVKGGKIKVSISKATADGFEIQYSTNKKFKKSKTKKVTAVFTSSVTSKTLTIKKLTKGKKYYVRSRAFSLNMNGTRTYGKWSKKKAINIKK